MSADQLVKTLLVQGGYYPDRFAEAGRPPDVFFISEAIPLSLLQGMDDVDAYWESVLAESVDLIATAIVEKYRRHRGVPWADIFWTAETRITKLDT